MQLSDWNRAQYADYIARFRPRENELIQYATDPNKPMEAATMAQGFVNQSFADNEAGFQRRLGGLNVTASPEQMESFRRKQTYSKGLSEVDAMNRSAQASADLQKEIFTGTQSGQQRNAAIVSVI